MHGSVVRLRNTSKHVINETIALCSERQENGTATTSKQAFNDFVLCGVTNNLPHPVKISLPLLCERDEQEVSAGHQQQTDNRSNRQRKTSKLRITKHLVGKQRGKHCNRRQTTHCSRLTNLSAKRQQQPSRSSKRNTKRQSPANHLQQLKHILLARWQIHKHAHHQHCAERIRVRKRLHERGNNVRNLHVSERENNHHQVRVERNRTEETLEHVAGQTSCPQGVEKPKPSPPYLTTSDTGILKMETSTPLYQLRSIMNLMR